MFGIEADDSMMGNKLRQSRDIYSKKSKNGIRSSIAGKFLMQKDTGVHSTNFHNSSVAFNENKLPSDYFELGKAEPSKSESIIRDEESKASKGKGFN